MEDDENYMSDVNKPSLDEGNVSKEIEVNSNEKKCEILSNLNGSNLVGDVAVVVPETETDVVNNGETEVVGGGDCAGESGDLDEVVVAEEVMPVEAKVLGNELDADVENRGEDVGATGNSCADIVAAELEVKSDVVETVGGVKSPALDDVSSAVAPEVEKIVSENADSAVAEGDQMVVEDEEEILVGNTNTVEEGVVKENVSEMDSVTENDGSLVVTSEVEKIVSEISDSAVAEGDRIVVEEEATTTVVERVVKEDVSEMESVTENEGSLVGATEVEKIVSEIADSAVAEGDQMVVEEEKDILVGATTTVVEGDVSEMESVPETEVTLVTVVESVTSVKVEKDEGTTMVEEKDVGTTMVEEKDAGTTMVEEKDEGTTMVEEKNEGTTMVEEKNEGTTMMEEKGLIQKQEDEIIEIGLKESNNGQGDTEIIEENNSLPENELESENENHLLNSVDKNGNQEITPEKSSLPDNGVKSETAMEMDLQESENAPISDEDEEPEEEEEEIETEKMDITSDEVDVGEDDTETDESRKGGDTDIEMEKTQSNNGENEDEEEDEVMVADEETESEKETGVKRKRGKNKSKVAKPIGEDVCFICFDGGALVICDRRGCSKAYHPSCVNHDDAFFKTGRWNCGWHLCSNCEKDAHYMCYTCTYSLCKACTKEADVSSLLCVRGNKGFCETCMKLVMLIENNEQGNGDNQVDFDDKSMWEFLFKDYFVELKAKLNLSLDEILEAKTPKKGPEGPSGKKNKRTTPKQESPETPNDNSDDSENAGPTRKSKRRKIKKQSKTNKKDQNSNQEWASKELLELVMHMKNGDPSRLSPYDVQDLLLEYIKRNNLREPRQKSKTKCDHRLQRLFGKPRVGHFEMLKLLESHFLIKEDDAQAQASIVDTEVEKSDLDTPKGSKERKRKGQGRKKGNRLGRQSNLEDYASIDMHNINLIFLRRKLMEDLLEDEETFKDKVVGTFARIRISGNVQKQDLYRLVQVVGTSVAPEPYKVGKRTTDFTVEILNLNKTEVVSIDTISNQDFTEEECKRLRQSIKCGLINRLTVGDILDKALELQTTRVNDWLEAEMMRLAHLRDRASETGRKKELRECVEKLQLLKTPDERQRRLEEIPEIHADPKMDPAYESEEEESEPEFTRRDNRKMRGSGSRGARGPISPRDDYYSKESWSTERKYPIKKWDLDRNLSSKNMLDNKGVLDTNDSTPDNRNNLWNQGRDRNTQESASFVDTESFTPVVAPPIKLEKVVVETITTPEININESEKMWYYKDPAGKVQGPFSIVQLRKWSKSGYFPAGLKIWKGNEKPDDDSIVLTNALAGKFQKESPTVGPSVDRWGRNESRNLPSPTPETKSVSQHGGILVKTDTMMSRSNDQQGRLMHSHNNNVMTGQDLGVAPLVQVNSGGGAPPAQKVEVNPVHGGGPQQGYNNNNNQWGSTVQGQGQGHAGHFANSGPVQGMQTNMQQQIPMQWGGGMPIDNTTPAPVVRPENPNFGWGNPNMGWVGQPPPQPQWVGAAPPGNAGTGWFMPPGVTPGQGPVPPVNTNTNQTWVPQSGGGAGGATTAPGTGWAPPPGPPGVPGTTNANNQGWGPPQQNWGGPEQNQGRGKFTARPWNNNRNNGGPRGSYSGNRHQTPCPYNTKGNCRKGASCDYLHI